MIALVVVVAVLGIFVAAWLYEVVSSDALERGFRIASETPLLGLPDAGEEPDALIAATGLDEAIRRYVKK